jgi:hypothetical protein
MSEPQGTEGQNGQPRKQPRPSSPRIKVRVTKEIIDRSEQRDSSHCMIAEAVREAVPKAQSVSVDLQTIRYTDPDKRLRYVFLTPRQAQKALVMFDQGIHGDPFEMLLRGGQVIRMGHHTSGRGSSTKTAPMPEGLTRELRVTSVSNPSVPEVVGGKAPPVGGLTNTRYGNKRRAFGLRALTL